MYKIIALTAFGLSVLIGPTMATPCTSYPYTLTNGTVADAAQVMANFNCAVLTSGASLTGATLNNVTLVGATFSGSPQFTTSLGIGTVPSTIFEMRSSQPQPLVSSIYETITTNDWYSQLRFRSPPGPGDEAFSYDDADIVIERGNHIFNADNFTHDSDLVFKVNTSNRDHPPAEMMRITSVGYVGIGTSSPGYPLQVAGTAYATGAAGALSDIRHKRAISPLAEGAIDLVMKLRPVSFQWKNPTDAGMQGKQMGFIAQDIEKVLPSAVLTEANAEKTKGIKYNELIAVLTKAVQEEESTIRSLSAANDNLAHQLHTLQEQRLADTAKLQTQLISLLHRLNIQTAQK